jgi:hypothetical protein
LVAKAIKVLADLPNLTALDLTNTSMALSGFSTCFHHCA